MTLRQQNDGFVFTGRHMVALMVLFFGTIISVNLTMAYFATTTWSGLVVPNTYVASQEFNGKAEAIRAMLATGIRSETEVTTRGIRYTLTIPDKGPVVADSVTVHFKRPVGVHQDFVAVLTPAGEGVYLAEREILPGEWIVEVEAMQDGKLVMHEANRISVAGE